MKFEVKFGNERLITPTGVGIAGLLLSKTDLKRMLDDIKLKDNANPLIKNSDVAISFIGLLCQGKSDFENVREMLEDAEFYQYALNIDRIPSPETTRQRLDIVGKRFREPILTANVKMLKETGVVPTPCYEDLVPLDIDVSPFDNSNTKKEGVSYTYKGYFGYAPIFAYLGTEGYQINMEFRKGSDHCQKETDNFLKETILLSKQVTNKPILVRLDSGNDSADNMKVCYSDKTFCDFIIKRNLRKESLKNWQIIAEEDPEGSFTSPREGKTVRIGSVYRHVKDLNREVRIVYQVTERTIDKTGQILLIPDIEVQTWWTSLDIPETDVIDLYKAHGTSEQFHSEIKTDMDLERLPSGNFATNALVMELAILAYNILRIIGQESLRKDDVAIKSKRQVHRRRLKTVIKNLINIASHVVRHGRQTYLSLGRSNIWRFTFKRLYDTFALNC